MREGVWKIIYEVRYEIIAQSTTLHLLLVKTDAFLSPPSSACELPVWLRSIAVLLNIKLSAKFVELLVPTMLLVILL